jgi:NAD(P)-dependent dehydrogenase (short-subunit alcohol dehydrogenase family)
MAPELEGRVALVTGSSRGIGSTIALALAQQGADVAVVYHRHQDAASEVQARIKALGRGSITVQADVTSAEDVEHLMRTTREQLGPVGILVNNVGEFALKPLYLLNSEEWDHILKSNLHSVFYCCRAVLEHMREMHWGRIINIGLSPMWQARGAPNIIAYATAKIGVLVLTRSLAIEEARHGITVSCVSPGLIDNGYLPPE